MTVKVVEPPKLESTITEGRKPSIQVRPGGSGFLARNSLSISSSSLAESLAEPEVDDISRNQFSTRKESKDGT